MIKFYRIIFSKFLRPCNNVDQDHIYCYLYIAKVALWDLHINEINGTNQIAIMNTIKKCFKFSVFNKNNRFTNETWNWNFRKSEIISFKYYEVWCLNPLK